ncbi:MAG TPA: NusG domain II-containing protein [Clostridia bacterium]|nr:NusG domain II-containing protein [Clostridia bacterium]
MRFKKGDLIIVVILAAAVIAWLGVNKLGDSKTETQAIIETNGSIYKTVPIKPGMEQEKIHIELGNGKHIDIVVDENGAFVEDVVCPDRICQKTGVVNKVGQSIVCLPNKVVVYIEGEAEAEIEIDDVSY